MIVRGLVEFRGKAGRSENSSKDSLHSNAGRVRADILMNEGVIGRVKQMVQNANHQISVGGNGSVARVPHAREKSKEVATI
jgi:hypothetical protein